MKEYIENKEFNINKQIIRIIKGDGIAIALSILFLLLFSVILTYSNISDTTIPLVIIVINMVAILIGSSISTMKLKKNGILNGIIIGLLYMGILYFLSSMINSCFILTTQSIIFLGLGIIAGAIGGIIGVNFK